MDFGEDEDPQRHHRKITWIDRAQGVAAICAVLTVACGSIAWAFDFLPFAKASELAAVKQDVSVLKDGLNTLQIGQKESQELQLMDRVQALSDRLEKVGYNGPDYAEFRQQRTEAQQRLDFVRSELRAARGRPLRP